MIAAKKSRRIGFFNPVKRRHHLVRIRSNSDHNSFVTALNKKKRLNFKTRIIPLLGPDENPVVSSDASHKKVPQETLRCCFLNKRRCCSFPSLRPEEETRPRCFRDLLKPEDLIPPRRVVPPPYPKLLSVQNPMDPSRTSHFSPIHPKEEDLEDISPSWEVNYLEGSGTNWNTGYEENNNTDNIFLEESTSARNGPLANEVRDHYDPDYYSQIFRGYDYHNYASLAPHAVVAGSPWECYGSLVSYSPFVHPYQPAPSYRPSSSGKPNKMTWDVHFHDYYLPPPPPPPSHFDRPELPQSSVPLPPPPLP
ncbi:hypothetical protein RB195_012773 [Necator americanus]|uniref:Uncharacterized protein n=1 Tax=Necator americanus TaxID=51031 RepID=A0ABR1DVA8_NECAM